MQKTLLKSASVATLKHWQKRFAPLLILISALSILTACSRSEDPAHRFQAYHEQLAHFTDAPIPAATTTPMPLMPRASAMRTEIDEMSISLLDSMRLDRCRAGQLIAQRNSALGRLRSPSARLRYELDMLKALHECRQSEVASDPRLDDMMAQAIAHKTQTLPQYIDRTLSQGDELRHAMRASRSTLAVGADISKGNTVAALRYLADTFEQAQDAPLEVSLDAYNSHLRTLAQSDFLPRHWRTQQRAAAWLQISNALLDKAKTRLNCAQDETAWRTLKLTYREDIEPLLAQWQVNQHTISIELERLQTHSLHGAWRAYVDELIAEGSHADRLQRRAKQHTALWQEILRQCDIG